MYNIRKALLCGVPFAVLRRGIARRVEHYTTYLVYTLALGGVGNAVAAYVKDAVADVLAGGGGIVLQLTVIHSSLFIDRYLQLGYRFAIGDDADARGVNGYVAAEETTVGTDGGAGGDVRVIYLIVPQAEVSVAGGGALQDTCAERTYQIQVAAIRAVVIACQGGYVAVVGVGIDSYVREDEGGLLCQFCVGIDDITFACFEGLRGSEIHLYRLVIQLLRITELEDAVVQAEGHHHRFVHLEGQTEGSPLALCELTVECGGSDSLSVVVLCELRVVVGGFVLLEGDVAIEHT